MYVTNTADVNWWKQFALVYVNFYASSNNRRGGIMLIGRQAVRSPLTLFAWRDSFTYWTDFNIIIIIIIIERKDLGGVMSKDCKATLHTLKKWQNASATQSENRVSVRCDRRQSCRDQENFGQTVPSSLFNKTRAQNIHHTSGHCW